MRIGDGDALRGTKTRFRSRGKTRQEDRGETEILERIGLAIERDVRQSTGTQSTVLCYPHKADHVLSDSHHMPYDCVHGNRIGARYQLTYVTKILARRTVAFHAQYRIHQHEIRLPYREHIDQKFGEPCCIASDHVEAALLGAR
jgi:hypothetical protein